MSYARTRWSLFFLPVWVLSVFPVVALADQKLPFYGLYGLQNGHLTEIPSVYESFEDRAYPNDGEDKAIFPLHSSAAVTFPNGRLSLVLFDPAAASSAREAIIYIAAKIRSGKVVQRPTSVAGSPPSPVFVVRDNVDIRRFYQIHSLQQFSPPFWVVRSWHYTFRSAPYGNDARMMEYRPPTSSFALPPGRYRIRLNGRNYDFAVAQGSAAPSPQQCVDILEENEQVRTAQCDESDRMPRAQSGGQAPVVMEPEHQASSVASYSGSVSQAREGRSFSLWSAASLKVTRQMPSSTLNTGGVASLTEWTSFEADNGVLQVSAFDWVSRPQGSDAVYVDRVVKDLAKRIAATITHQVPISLNGRYEGVEFTVVSPGGQKHRARTIMTPNHLFIVDFTAPDDSRAWKSAEQALSSFTILQP